MTLTLTLNHSSKWLRQVVFAEETVANLLEFQEIGCTAVAA